MEVSQEVANKILIVENNQAQQLLYREELEEEGYDVVLVGNGKEALRSLDRSLFDLIVLDVLIPETDGVEVLGKIVSRHHKIPIILHTSYPRDKTEFISWLADATLVKSSDFTQLKRTVKELLETKPKISGGRSGISPSGGPP